MCLCTEGYLLMLSLLNFLVLYHTKRKFEHLVTNLYMFSRGSFLSMGIWPGLSRESDQCGCIWFCGASDPTGHLASGSTKHMWQGEILVHLFLGTKMCIQVYLFFRRFESRNLLKYLLSVWHPKSAYGMTLVKCMA